MDKLGIPHKDVDNVLLIHPLNDWLARTKRRGVVCVTVGNALVGFREPDGIFLVTHIRYVRKSPNAELPVERDQDRYVKKWLVGEGGAKEESLRWLTIPDAEEFGMFYATGTRPRLADGFTGPRTVYEFNVD